MVMSMTGFARRSVEQPWGSATWELKSVNHRYLEVNFRLPEAFRLYEAKWKQCLQKQLKRGKVECVLKYMPGEQMAGELKLNNPLIEQLAAASHAVQSAFQKDNATNPMDVLAWPGVVQTQNANAEALVAELQQELDQAVGQLVEMRQTEGKYLQEFMQQRISEMQALVDRVEMQMPNILEQQQQKLVGRFEELAVECDKDRLEQEMVWLMQKADVAEELHRLSAHLKEVQAVLLQKGAVGRRLDFIMQELNREANTLASKSIDLGVTNASVDLKVLIEQMREQVQNIE
ncbi:MAG: YicC family protein [Coxiellaceae bacterium]|nr:YicC family protein [Coxiellaceae bacterium]